ncbi:MULTISPECIES: hypothetical protein [unclassified Flavobacterium]|uniref:hypothetical protein n=1 Tax=unclassified Flavobacterium TaxID=196869 RepID=UPI00096507EA|nr:MULTISPECIES: hypothetical protein [unclassified Flavobacterium]MBN9285596.1 hypothetical protein [Flavobacterium sp.]OJV71048.1 MAG: hypothetical protein BGO42_04335 [Flavobacterium sp. 40-81]
MKNLNKLHEVTLKIKSIIYNINLKENDVRKAYFENLYSIINEFYHGKIFYKVCQEIKNGTIKFDPSVIELKPHITRIYEIADHKLLSDAYHNELNRKLFVDSFTNFETTVSFCFEEIIDDINLNKIIKGLNNKVIRICNDLPDEKKETLLGELQKNTFIPLSRKFRFLSKYKDTCYSSDPKQDLEFIEFCSKLRNCISHSAGYYKGKDFEYEFENIKFIFKNDTFLEMVGENDYVFLKINEKLTNIIYALMNCLKEIDFIKYPDDGF